MKTSPGDVPTHKTIILDGNRITFVHKTGHGAVLESFLAVALALTPFTLFFDASLGYGILALQAFILPDLIALFCRNFSNWSARTTFDCDAALVTHANMLGNKSPLPFSEVGDLVRVATGFGDGMRVSYKVTPKGGRFTRGWPLTSGKPSGDPQLRDVEERILPALRRAIGAAGGLRSETFTSDAMRHYKRGDAGFTRVARKKTPIFLILVALMCLVRLPTATLGIIVLLAANLIYVAFGMTRLTIDPASRTLRFRHLPFGRARTIPLADVLGIEQIQPASIVQPYAISLRFRQDEKENSVLLCHSYFNRIAETVADETEALLSAIDTHPDPSNPETPASTTIAP